MAGIDDNVSEAQMASELAPDPWEKQGYGEGPNTYALGVGVVTAVDYEKLEATIRMVTGEDSQHVPLPLTFPGAGARHFFGALPMIGDVGIIGWGAGEGGKTRKPYILSWLVNGVMSGHDWWPTQPFGPDELDLPPKQKALFEGIANRTRHKLRHMTPGNIVASSAQGSDMVLNESVLLANRRANEIRLRDQDQAFVVRSLQQFHAMAGARMYGGMVQRDATFLPTQMFSDGTEWDAAKQVDEEGHPIKNTSLGANPVPRGGLTPATVFQRNATGARSDATLAFGANLDPYDFLQKGLFINTDGTTVGDTSASAVYGGKPIFRVATTGVGNAAIDPQAQTLTELRWEVSHTSDGTLPVTEQTDNFDSDRLPDSIPRDTSPLNESINSPFIQFVMGSVVGNDPFSSPGRAVYGIPLRPVVFEGKDRSPNMVSALGFPLAEHAASLFSITPPIGTNSEATFASVTKDGRLFASVSGPGTSPSAEFAFGAGFRVGAGVAPSGESFRFESDGAIILQSNRGALETNNGIDIQANNGAIRIYAQGTTTVGRLAAASSPVGGGEGALPSLTLETATNMLIRAKGTMKIAAGTLDLSDIGNLTLRANNAFNIQAGDRVSIDP